MSEDRGGSTERGEHLQLAGAVGDMVLAAQDVGHAHVDVVDHAGQEVEPAAVGPANDRIADQRRIEALLTPDEVGPFDRAVVREPEPPMGGDIGGRRRVIGLAFVDRGEASPEQHLAAEIEFLGRFVAGIDPPGGAQPRELAIVQREAVGLAEDGAGDQPEPRQIVLDRSVERGGRSFAVGIVDP